MSSNQLPRLDSPTRVAAFGARFSDPACSRTLNDGLAVSLFPAALPLLRREAIANASGVFSIPQVPGLRAFELSDGRGKAWTDALAAPQAFVIEIRDRLDRFHAVSMKVSLPTPGPFGSGTSVAGLPALVPLLIAPGRRAPPAVAVLRADLGDARSAKSTPLRHALLAVDCNGKEVGSGIADAQGRVAVMFAYPEPTLDALFAWPVTLRLYCDRPDKGFADSGGATPLPDLQALQSQRNSSSWQLFGSWDAGTATGVALDVRTLQLGHELVVQTTGCSSLLAQPA